MHSFRAVLMVAVCTIALTQIAPAADIPTKAPPAVITASPVYSWTGLYIGANVGGAWSTTDWTFFNGATLEPIGQHVSKWLAGGQIGYLYQFNPNWVAGAEVSWSRTDLKATSGSIAVADRLRQSQITDLLLIAGRFGYASNNWLGYIKGGYANLGIDFNTFVASSGLATTTSSGRDGGWVVGGGVEYAFSPYVTASAEYNFVHVNIGDRNQAVTPGFVTPETVASAQVNIQTVWARLNFRFAPFAGYY